MSIIFPFCTTKSSAFIDDYFLRCCCAASVLLLPGTVYFCIGMVNRKYLSLLALFVTSVVVNANESVVKFIPGCDVESVQLTSIECRNATNTNWENPKNDPINESGNSTLTIEALKTLYPGFASTFNSEGGANKPSIATGAYYHKSPQALYSLVKIQLKLKNDTMIDDTFYLGQGRNFYLRNNWWLASKQGKLYKTPKYPGSPRRDGITVQDSNNKKYCIYAYQGDFSVNTFIINEGKCNTDENKEAINAWSKTSKVVGVAAGALTIIGGVVGATAAVLANQHANNNQPALTTNANNNQTALTTNTTPGMKLDADVSNTENNVELHYPPVELPHHPVIYQVGP